MAYLRAPNQHADVKHAVVAFPFNWVASRSDYSSNQEDRTSEAAGSVQT